MSVMEKVGMVASGAILMLGAVHFLGFGPGQSVLPAAGSGAGEDVSELAPVSPPVASPAVAQPVEVASAPAEPAAVAEPTPEQVTRVATDLSGVGPVSAEDGAAAEAPLSPLQLQVISYFERSARDLNQSNTAQVGALLQFSNMSIDRLNVQYFYRFGRDYAALDRNALMAIQEALVRDNVCNTPSILTLMEEYGFRYSYTYTSYDHRLVGVIEADASTCL